jgi:glucose/mannose transport system substrate-binding protein
MTGEHSMNKMSVALRRTALALALASGAAGASAGEVEVLHYWTSGGEAKSVDLLKQMVAAKGVTWKDLAVESEIGAMKTLGARFKANNAVTAAQFKSPQIQYWGREGALANLDALASQNNWDSLLPHAIADSMKYNGHYVAVPVNVHRENWLYINVAAFEKAGAKVPTNFDELFEAADKLKAAGVIPFAWGGQPWQDAVVFESIVLGVGGPAFYDKVFVRQDQAALTSPTMLKAWEIMGRIRGYLDRYNVDREWNLATSMVIHGKGGMQFMGDWAKGEFIAKGKVPGRDFMCVAAPSTQNAFIYAVDSLGMYTVNGEARQHAQKVLAETIMSPEFQEAFNLNKGSIPARSGVSRARFDSCATKSMDDMTAASAASQMVPAISMAMDGPKTTVFHGTAAKFMTTAAMTPEDAMRELASGLRTIGQPKG